MESRSKIWLIGQFHEIKMALIDATMWSQVALIFAFANFLLLIAILIMLSQ